MNTNQFKFLIISCLLAGCSADLTRSQEEIEYEKYASVHRNNLIGLQKPPEKWDETYKESGLQEFIYGPGEDYFNKGNKTLSDLDEFYERVILDKYANNEYQEKLRIKFIGYAATAFRLTQPKDAETTQYLIKYTRELSKNERALDADLSFKCISSIRGMIDKNEYNDMVKKTKFHTRFFVELFQQTLAEAKETDPKEIVDQLRTQMETYKKYQNDFETLVIK